MYRLTHANVAGLLSAAALAMAGMAAPPPLLAAPQAAVASARKVVKTVADLPVFTYKVPAQLDTLLTSDAAWAPFAATMRANLEGVLRNYDIEDRKTRQAIELDLLQLDLDANRNAEAEARHARVLELEDKPELRVFGAQTFPIAAVLDARRASGASAGPVYHAALARAYAARLAKLPDPVSAHVARIRGIYEEASPDLAINTLMAALAPQAAKNGNTLDAGSASFLLWMRTLHRQLLPTRAELLPAFAAHLAVHPPVAIDIWSDRDVALESSATLTPVTVAIWDSGVDATQFPGRMFVNPQEMDNGRDNDGNGFIADVHGIAWDEDLRRTTGALFPVDASDLAEFPRMVAENRTRRDVRAGVDNVATRALKAKTLALTPAQVANEARLERVFMGYWHGTAVANMAGRGNPAARILSARFVWDVDPAGTPKVVDDAAWANRFAAFVHDTVAYCKAHGVRVVNMSWMLTAEIFADNLRRSGTVKSEAELQRQATERLRTIRAAMQSAFASAPEILFVAGAGNDDNNAAFHESLPGTIDLPNVLAVGAVDEAGAAASFTSFGKNVTLYAKGVDLDVLVPGGAHIVDRGTSFAAPQVVNLAAKLLAVNPQLGTAEVVRLIRDGASTGADQRLVLINPKRSLELLSERR